MHALLKRLANPRDRFGGFFVPHAALIAMVVVFVLGFALGWFSNQTVYNASYFETHYPVSVQMRPPLHAHVYAAPLPQPGEASLTDLDVGRYPAVGDQGAQGACDAWATAWILSYDYRIDHPRSWIRFSPAWMYTGYSDSFSNGQDEGSWSQGNLQYAATLGIPQFTVYPAPQPIVDPFPTQAQIPDVYANAAKHVLATTVDTLYLGDPNNPSAGGDMAYQEIMAALNQGKPALLAINVTPSFDNATITGGDVDYYGPEGSRGGHAIVALRRDANHLMTDLQPGILAQNQWRKVWGHKGRAWLSRAWIDHFVWGVQTISIG